MKKILLSLIIPFAISIASYAGVHENSSRTANHITCPEKFLDNPPVYFYCIYSDYHKHKFDEGIKKAEKALNEIEPLYKKNPEMEIPNANGKGARLKENKAYQVKSNLHMLLGMLCFKKALNLEGGAERKIYFQFEKELKKKGLSFLEIDELMNLYTMKKVFPEAFKEKQERRYRELLKKAGISEKEIDDLSTKTREEEERLNKKRYSLISRAIKEFQTAVKVNPENAMAYFQMGNFYSGIAEETEGEGSEAAEDAYYKAALILRKQGDEEGYREVLKRLKLLNPGSKYLKLLEGKKDA